MASLDVRIDPTQARQGSQVVRRELRSIGSEARTTGSAVRRHIGGDFRTASEQAKRSVAGIASSLRGVGTILGGLVGFTGVTSLVRAFASGQAAATTFEGSIQDLSAITGAVGNDLEFFTAAAREMGATTTFSAAQAADAFTLIASAKPDLLSNADALKQVTQESLSLAEAAGITLPDAANVLGISLNQFGLAADQAGRVINVLAAGAKFGASQITDTAAALKNAGVTAQTAGVSFETMNAAIQVLASVGLRGAEAGTPLRNILLKLEQQSESFRPSVVGLSQALQNASDEFTTTSTRAKVFGSENINAFNALSNGIPLLRQLEDNITGTGVAYEQAAIRVDDLEGDLAALNSAWEDLNIAIRDTESLRSTVQGLTDLFRLLAGHIERINELQEEGFVPATQYDYLSQDLTNLDARLGQLTERLQDLRQEKADIERTSDQDLISLQSLEDQIVAVRTAAYEVGQARAAVLQGQDQDQQQILDDLSQVQDRLVDITLEYLNLGRRREEALAYDMSGRLFPFDYEGEKQRLQEALEEAKALRERLFSDLERSTAPSPQVEEYTDNLDRLNAEVGSLIALQDQYSVALREGSTEVAQIEERIVELSNSITDLRAEQLRATNQANWDSVTAQVENYRDAIVRLADAQRVAGQEARATEQANAPPSTEQLDPLARLRGLNTIQLLRRAQTLLREVRTPQETLDLERQRIELFRERGILTDELAQRARVLAQEEFDAATQGVQSGRELVDVHRALVDALLPRQSAQDLYAQRVADINLLEQNAQKLGLSDIDIIRLRIGASRDLSDQLGELEQAQREVNDVTAQVVQRYLPTVAAQQRYHQALRDIEEANLGVVDTEQAKINALREYERAIGTTTSSLDRTVDETKDAVQVIRGEFETLGGDVAGALASAFLGAETQFDGFLIRLAQRALSAQLEANVINPILGFASTFLSAYTGGFSYNYASTGGANPGLSGALQSGGAARAGGSYIVGEAGPELLTQGARGGFVTPLSQGRGGGVTVNIYSGDAQAEVEEREGQSGEQVIDVTVGSALGRMSDSGELDALFGSYGGRRSLTPR